MDPVDVLGLPVNPVGKEDLLKAIEENLTRRHAPEFLLAMNPIKVILAPRNQSLMEDLRTATCFFPDAIGIVWALRMLHGIKTERIAGFELLFDILSIANRHGLKVTLVGARPESLRIALQRLHEKYPNARFVAAQHGYFEGAERRDVLDRIVDAEPDILFVGLGTVKQERFIAEIRSQVSIPLCMSVGGSFDVISEFSPRAPRWLCRLGFEWLYRLFRQPKRWKAMLPLPVFAARVMMAFFKAKLLPGSRKRLPARPGQ